jgi:hypothetical protein
MKGARQRGPVRAERIFRQTLLASALYAALTTHSAFAQPSSDAGRDPAQATFERSSNSPLRPIDVRVVRTQHRTGRNVAASQAAGRDLRPMPSMQQVQQADPPARTPRHAVMTPDERKLLRQHIEEAVRDLYKR